MIEAGSKKKGAARARGAFLNLRQLTRSLSPFPKNEFRGERDT